MNRYIFALLSLLGILALLLPVVEANMERQSSPAMQRGSICHCARKSRDRSSCLKDVTLEDMPLTAWMNGHSKHELDYFGLCRDEGDPCYGNLTPQLHCTYDSIPFVSQEVVFNCSLTTDPDPVDQGQLVFVFNFGGVETTVSSGVAYVTFDMTGPHPGSVTVFDTCGNQMTEEFAINVVNVANADCFNGRYSCDDCFCHGATLLTYPENTPGCDVATETCYGTCEFGYKQCLGTVLIEMTATTPMDEFCNDGLNTNCDAGEQDNDNAVNPGSWYPDVDGDGFGDGTVAPVVACLPPTQDYADNGNDCDDSNHEIYPGAPELCDGVSNACPPAEVDAGFTYGDPCNTGPCRIAGVTECSADGLSVVCSSDAILPEGQSCTTLGGLPGECNNGVCDELQCTPLTCADLYAEGRCGPEVDDACGGFIDCQQPNDGDQCNGEESCDNTGVVDVVPFDAPTCADYYAAGQCGEQTDICGNTRQCNSPDDGNVCNGEESCDPVTKVVSVTPAPDCDDGISCTTDSCDEYAGCLNVPNDAACEDVNDCTIDSCLSTGCSNAPLDDGDSCSQGGTGTQCYNGFCVCANTGAACGTDVGACTVGVFQCIDGQDVCSGVAPQPEDCASPTADLDCDGLAGCDDPDCAGDPVCDVCVPLTCQDAGAACGAVADGCGGTLSCGICARWQGCNAENQCQNTPCDPDCNDESCIKPSGTCCGDFSRVLKPTPTVFVLCAAPEVMCDASCDQRCSNLQTDRRTCGDCSVSCAAGDACQNGVCVSASVCGNGVVEAGEQCDDGNVVNGDGCDSTCQIECSTGLTNCGGVCVDTTQDEQNCGACGATCASGEGCQSGVCVAVCIPDCNGKNCGDDGCGGVCGTCDGSSPVCHEGVCGPACLANAECTNLQCCDLAIDGGTCDPFTTNAATCPQGEARCGTCANPRQCLSIRSNERCGSCFNNCTESGLVCDVGTLTCIELVCPAGQTDCGGVCVDIAVDNGNCGGCGVTCGAGETCQSGACVLTDHCLNGVKDADETDVDCGGADCPLCQENQLCNSASDCANMLPCYNGSDADFPVVNTCVDNNCCLSCGSYNGNLGRAGICTLFNNECYDISCAGSSCDYNIFADGNQCLQTTEGFCVSGECNVCADCGTRCGLECVDLATDSSNCGTCGTSCGSNYGEYGEVCVAGGCARRYENCVDNLGQDSYSCGQPCLGTDLYYENNIAPGIVCLPAGQASNTADFDAYGTLTCDEELAVATSFNFLCIDGYRYTLPGTCEQRGLYDCGGNCSYSPCPACPLGKDKCCDDCFDFSTDNENCGACGTTCASGEGCQSGVCQPNPVCGNGVVEAGEQCDDGNVADGDGCSATCQSEVVAPGCGDGVVEGPEGCDDGNLIDGDGCSSTCLVEGQCLDQVFSLITVETQISETVVPPPNTVDASVTAAGGGGGGGGSVDPDCAGFGGSRGNVETWTYAPSRADYAVVVGAGGLGVNENRFRGRPGGPTAVTPSGLTTWSVNGGLGGLTGDNDCASSTELQGEDAPDVGGIGGQTIGADGTRSAGGAGGAGGDIPITDTGGDGGTGIVIFQFNVSVCGQYALCGNGNVEVGEQCDDGNGVGGDGCSTTCQIEECGNGVLDVGEECDDGNAVSGDGCSSQCSIETCNSQTTFSYERTAAGPDSFNWPAIPLGPGQLWACGGGGGGGPGDYSDSNNPYAGRGGRAAECVGPVLLNGIAPNEVFFVDVGAFGTGASGGSFDTTTTPPGTSTGGSATSVFTQAGLVDYILSGGSAGSTDPIRGNDATPGQSSTWAGTAPPNLSGGAAGCTAPSATCPLVNGGTGGAGAGGGGGGYQQATSGDENVYEGGKAGNGGTGIVRVEVEQCDFYLPVPNECGNGVLEGAEECDDGNAVDGDGCSSTCQIEAPCAVDADCPAGTVCDANVCV